MSHAQQQQSLARYRVRVSGTGGPWVDLGHGTGNDQPAWACQVPVLEAGCRVVNIDFPGATSGADGCFDPAHFRSMHGPAEDQLAGMLAAGVSDAELRRFRALALLSSVALDHQVQRTRGFASSMASLASPFPYAADCRRLLPECLGELRDV